MGGEARPHLLAGDQVPTFGGSREGLDRRKVRAGVRLGEALAPVLFAGQNRGQVTLLLLDGAALDERGGGEDLPDPSVPVRRVGPGSQLAEHDLFGQPESATTELDRERQAGKAASVELPVPLHPDLVRLLLAERAAVSKPLGGDVVGQPGLGIGGKHRYIGHSARHD